MSDTDDPFRHHPELRDLIEPPETSKMRDLNIEGLREIIRSHGVDADAVMLTDVEREASLAAFLDALPPGDLWVFGYGSLMWNPAFFFEEVRRAHSGAHARAMLIKDVLGGRGTPEAPGMIAALDHGTGCTGLAFRIAAPLVGEEVRRIWTRERVLPAYHAEMIELDTDHGPIRALAFVADHTADLIDDTLSRDEIVGYIATGAGFLGTSLEYVESMCAHLETLSIDDPALFALRDEARALAT